MLRCSRRMAGLRYWEWWRSGGLPTFTAMEEPNVPEGSSEMSRDFDIRNIDTAAIERDARRLRAKTLSSGLRSVRNWTVGMLQRRPEGRIA